MKDASQPGRNPSVPGKYSADQERDFSPIIALLCDEGWGASELISQLPAVSRNGSLCCLQLTPALWVQQAAFQAATKPKRKKFVTDWSPFFRSWQSRPF